MIKAKTKYAFVGFSIAISLLLVFVLFVFQFFHLFDSQLQDKLFIKEKISEQIAIVAIDDRSITHFGSWPWDRNRHAQMIEKLEKLGVKAIGYDVTFSERGIGDENLLGVIKKYDNLVFPCEGSLTLSKNAPAHFKEMLWPLPAISENALVGHTTLLPDKDGKIRRMPFLVNFENTDIAPFFALLSQKAFGSDLNFLSNKYSNLFRIKYFGPARTFATYAFSEVLADDFDVTKLQGKVVLVGATAPDLHDEYFTPSSGSRALPGVEIQANLLESSLGQYALREITSYWSYLLIYFVLALLVGFFAFRFKLPLALLLSVIVLLLYYLAVVIAFVFGVVVSILYPSLLIVLTFINVHLAKYWLESEEKRKIRQAFSQYVAKEVVDDLIANPDKVKLGGEKRNLSIMFSDIRGFTSLSEKMTPEGLVAYLNDYLTEMTNVVLQNKGVVDKFIGDAIMAFWGAPLTNENHEKDSACAAILMNRQLAIFNQRKKAQGLPEIKTGIGINSGEVIVGNLGSHQRFDYTVIGDSVNLSSRLEGLTKYYGVPILVSGKTANQTKDDFVLIKLDCVAVKGKKEGVDIYHLAGFKEDWPQYQDLNTEFVQALNLYAKQDWAEASKAFEKLKSEYPDYHPIDLYIERVAEFIKNPPKDFDGVFRADFK